MNVKINESWRIENNDSMNYTLIERVELDQEKTKVKNTHRDVVRGYYGSLKACLKAYVHRSTDSSVIEGDVKQLIALIEKVEKDVEEFVK